MSNSNGTKLSVPYPRIQEEVSALLTKIIAGNAVLQICAWPDYKSGFFTEYTPIDYVFTPELRLAAPRLGVHVLLDITPERRLIQGLHLSARHLVDEIERQFRQQLAASLLWQDQLTEVRLSGELLRVKDTVYKVQGLVRIMFRCGFRPFAGDRCRPK